MAHRSLLIIRCRLFTMAAALSLLLCVATVAVWIRAQFVGDQFSLTYRGISWAVESYTAHLVVERWRGPYYDAGLDSQQDHPSLSNAPLWEVRFERLGPSMISERGARLFVPYPLLLLLTAPLSMVGILRVRRALQRSSPGLCPTCGYDLRATPDRCPECGTMTSRS